MKKFVVDEETAAQFLKKVRIGASDECWPWTGCVQQNGRGLFYAQGQVRYAHRVAWLFFNKKPLKRRVNLLHKCGNPGCCNPEHLCWRIAGAPGVPKSKGRPKGPLRYSEALTTRFAQLRAKGYSYTQIAMLEGIDRRRAVEIATGQTLQGRVLVEQKNGQEILIAPKTGGLSKLTEDAVKSILELLRDGHEISAISKAFNVTEMQVRRIKKRKIWKNVAA